MPVQYESKWFASADAKHRCALYIWRPDTPVKGIVQILHGMREHMGRYGDFAAFLTQQGYVVCGHDHLGHGKSVAEDGEYGYFAEEDGCRILIKDSHRATGIIRRQYPYRPLFLLGHSMGSFIGRLYILHFAAELSGFLCLGTSGEQKLAPCGRAVASLLTRLQGEQARGRLLEQATFGAYHRRFRGEESPSSWLSRDPAAVGDYDADEHCRPGFTNRGYADLYTMITAAGAKRWYSKVDRTLPILLASGADDPVGGYGKGVVQVYERLKLAGVLDVQCKLYPGARHELLNELNKEEVYYDLAHWMDRHLDTHRRNSPDQSRPLGELF